MTDTASATQDRIDDLVRILQDLDTQWELGDTQLVKGLGECCLHPDTNEPVPNGEYDDMVEELKKLDPQNDRFTRPGGSDKDSSGKKVKHDPPLTSISKASHEDLSKQEEMLFDWIGKTWGKIDGNTAMVDVDGHRQYPKGRYYQEYKLDGVALALYYVDGNLKVAATRPRDGINGEDVTEQVKYIDSIPKKLKVPVTCSIRGELVCLKPDFEKVQKMLAAAGEKLRANPRNHTAGAIRNFKEPSKVKDMRLTYIAYGIEAMANPPYKSESEKAKWCNQKLGIRYVRCMPFNFGLNTNNVFKHADFKRMEDDAKDLDYEVDGIVIGVDDIAELEKLGRHGDTPTGNPRGKLAWKFREEVAQPEIKSIDIETGRTGKISFVANFDGVQLAGTNVQRATLHNFGFMKKHGITVGTVVRVIKAGKIIPKVIGVVSGKGTPHLPDKCPSCGEQATLVKGGTAKNPAWDLWCFNDDCPAKLASNMEYYFTTLGVLGLGESKIQQLIKGGVKNRSDFYKLDEGDIQACGLSERQAILALAAIHMVPSPEKEKDNDRLRSKIRKAMAKRKEVPAWQFFAALGIKTAGKSAGKELINELKTIDAIRSASVVQLNSVKGVGGPTAQIIYDYMREHSKEIDALLRYVVPQGMKTGKLSGVKFCLSGAVDKKHCERLIEEQGGICSGISRSTNYLVAGPGSGEKSDKAKQYGVPIIDQKELEKMLK